MTLTQEELEKHINNLPDKALVEWAARVIPATDDLEKMLEDEGGHKHNVVFLSRTHIRSYLDPDHDNGSYFYLKVNLRDLLKVADKVEYDLGAHGFPDYYDIPENLVPENNLLPETPFPEIHVEDSGNNARLPEMLKTYLSAVPYDDGKGIRVKIESRVNHQSTVDGFVMGIANGKGYGHAMSHVDTSVAGFQRMDPKVKMAAALTAGNSTGPVHKLMVYVPGDGSRERTMAEIQSIAIYNGETPEIVYERSTR